MKKTGSIAGVMALGILLWLSGRNQMMRADTAVEQESDKEQETEGETENITSLDWYVNFSWFAESWGKNLVSRTITKETGVNVNFVTPSGNESEKLSALIASDSLPDMITLGWWEPQVAEMIDGGMVYALNELADAYDTTFWQVTNPDIVSWYTGEDGNIYGYPNSSYTPEDLEEHDDISANETFLVRKDIYEAIGSPDMTTQEGFEAAVQAAVAMFPEVNGQPLIPIGAHAFDKDGNPSFDKYLMDFLAVPFEKDGQLYDRYTDPDYISWLKFFRRMGQEGYLSDDIFVDQRTQMEEKLAKGQYFCMIYQYTDMTDQQIELYKRNPDSIYIAVDGPKNEAGHDPVLPVTGANGWTVTMISKNCKDPQKAIQFMDYLMSEQGQKVTYLGVEGITYDTVDGKPVLKKSVKELLNSDRRRYNEIYGADDTYWMLQNNVMQLSWNQETTEAIEQLRVWTQPYTFYNGQYDSLLPANSKEENEDTNIKLLWSKTLKELLLADSDEEFETILQDYVSQREALGYEEVQAMKTQLTDEAKQKLGME